MTLSIVSPETKAYLIRALNGGLRLINDNIGVLTEQWRAAGAFAHQTFHTLTNTMQWNLNGQ